MLISDNRQTTTAGSGELSRIMTSITQFLTWTRITLPTHQLGPFINCCCCCCCCCCIAAGIDIISSTQLLIDISFIIVSSFKQCYPCQLSHHLTTETVLVIWFAARTRTFIDTDIYKLDINLSCEIKIGDGEFEYEMWPAQEIWRVVVTPGPESL